MTGCASKAPSQGDVSGQGASLWGNQQGAIMVMGLFMATVLVGALYYVVGIGEAVAHREAMQDGADAAALSAAITIARGMNAIVLINLVMAALVLIILVLKLIVTLLGIAALILAGCFMFGLAATVGGWAYEVNQVANEVQNIVFRALEVCHYAEYVVKIVTPAAAEVVTVTDSTAPPVQMAVVLPDRWTLPVESGDYSKLCRKAGEWTGQLVGELLPLPRFVVKALKKGVGALAESLSEWFCGDGGARPPMSGSPPSVKYDTDKVFPTWAENDRCEAKRLDGSVEYATAPGEGKWDIDSPRPYKAGSTCDNAEKTRQSMLPPEDHYDDLDAMCEAPCDRKIYESNLSNARQECNAAKPAHGKEPKGYMYSTARFVDVYEWHKQSKTFSLVDTEVSDIDVHGRREEAPSGNGINAEAPPASNNPCARYWLTFDRFNRKLKPWNLAPNSPNGEIRRPVCGPEPTGIPQVDPKRPPMLEDGALVKTDPYTAVLDVYYCTIKVTQERQISMDGLGGLGGSVPGGEGEEQGDDKKAPFFVEKGLEQGAGAFQVRSIAIGKGAPGAWVDRVINVGAWGKRLKWSEPGLDFVEDLKLGNFALAQAEFFFEPPSDSQDDHASRVRRATDKDSWNWEMGWRARLVPFTLPSKKDDSGKQGQSSSQPNARGGGTPQPGTRGGGAQPPTQPGQSSAQGPGSTDSNAPPPRSPADFSLDPSVSSLLPPAGDYTKAALNQAKSGLQEQAGALPCVPGASVGLFGTKCSPLPGLPNPVTGLDRLDPSSLPSPQSLLDSGTFSSQGISKAAQKLLPEKFRFPPTPETLCDIAKVADADIGKTCVQVITTVGDVAALINH